MICVSGLWCAWWCMRVVAWVTQLIFTLIKAVHILVDSTLLIKHSTRFKTAHGLRDQMETGTWLPSINRPSGYTAEDLQP